SLLFFFFVDGGGVGVVRVCCGCCWRGGSAGKTRLLGFSVKFRSYAIARSNTPLDSCQLRSCCWWTKQRLDRQTVAEYISRQIGETNRFSFLCSFFPQLRLALDCLRNALACFCSALDYEYRFLCVCVRRAAYEAPSWALPRCFTSSLPAAGQRNARPV
ncbi:unnamed protein product, partial [Laminaria digitata]